MLSVINKQIWGWIVTSMFIYEIILLKNNFVKVLKICVMLMNNI